MNIDNYFVGLSLKRLTAPPLFRVDTIEESRPNCKERILRDVVATL